MRYCPDCGAGHECEAQAAATRTDPGVEIARIQADRDVTLAKLGARQQREELETVQEIAETEAEADVIVGVAQADAIAAELGAETTEEPEVIIDAPPVDAEPEADVEELPPVDGSPVPDAAARRARGLGMW